MIDFTEEDKASLDSFSFRSILNIDPAENATNKDKASNSGQCHGKSTLSTTTTSPKKLFDQANPNLNSFYLPNACEADDEDENHFKSMHLPSKTDANNTSLKDSFQNGIELDSVKHKLSSLWNNVKYGWSNYLKKPNKIDLDKNELIIILGKRFNQPESTAYDQENSAGAMNKWGNSSFYFYNDANDKMPSIDINYSFINPVDYESHSKMMTNNNKSKLSTIDSNPSNNYNPNHNNTTNNNNNTNDDYLSMTYSYLSSSSIFSNILSKSLSSESITNGASSKKLLKMTNDNMKTPLEQEIYSRLWFTYRKDFSPLLGNNNSKYTSDCGWGCMLRTGQMLIAQGLLYHIFGPDWSLYTSLQSDADISTYRELISLFNDRRSRECPFGIHNLLEIADKKASDEGVKGASSRVGTWFGPTSVCLLLRDALNGAALVTKNKQLESVRIYVAQDCTIFKQDVIDLCTDSGRVEFMPCILLISARLGGESINEIYVDSLKMFFQMQNCIGMIGGRPKHSLYFIGYQNEKVIYLDPHICQPTTNVYPTNDKSNNANSSQMQTSLDESTFNSFQSSELFDNSSFHCASPSKLAFSKLDPSIAIGFYCKSRDEFNEFCDFIKKSSTSDLYYPIFGICDETFEKTQLNYEMFSIHDKHSLSAPKTTSTKANLAVDIGSRSQTSTSASKSNKNSDQSEFSSRSSKHAKTSENLKQHHSKTSKGTSSSKTSSFNKSGSLSALNKSRKTSNKKNDPDDFVLV